MLDFKPSDEDMVLLPLDVVVYIKASIISENKETNYDFIRFFFQNEEVINLFKDPYKTVFYDFDGTSTDHKKFVTILELYSLVNATQCEELLVETFQKYSHEADLIFDLYTHDNKIYRLSNLDGIVKYEPLHPLN